MARGRSKGTVVNNQLHYSLANGVQYIDVFKDLSALNRKLIRQGRVAYLTDITYTAFAGNAQAGGRLIMTALPNDWVHNNSWKKAQAHWLGQQREARKMIGQSAQPTWEDFKVYYDATHASGSTLAMPGLSYGEWIYSKLITEADDASVIEWNLHMQGADTSDDKGLVLAYQQSRATVQATDPELPAEYSNNLYALMAQDENATADEVAQNMEDDNDAPPYDQNDYPGNDSNAVTGHYVELVGSAITSAVDRSGSVMCAPLGLLKLSHQGISTTDGSVVTAPSGYLQFRIAYGNYKGLAAPGFGQ